jgi:hypothetical protein
MEILKHGNLSFKLKCQYCGCKFRYNLNDINFIEKKGSELKYEFVECPECTLRIPVNKKHTE